MINRQWILAGVMTGCFSSAALAADIDASKIFDTCMDNSGGVTMAMMDCIHEETARQDQRLNVAYKVLMEQLSPERNSQLRKAQRAWMAFRDANCQLYFDPEGGSIARVSASDCVRQATESRARELERLQQ